MKLEGTRRNHLAVQPLNRPGDRFPSGGCGSTMTKVHSFPPANTTRLQVSPDQRAQSGSLMEGTPLLLITPPRRSNHYIVP